jgi:hypothetical protein
MRGLKKVPGGAMSGTREPNNGMMWTIVSVVHHQFDTQQILNFQNYQLITVTRPESRGQVL